MKTSQDKSNLEELTKSDLIARYNQILQLVPKIQPASQQVTNLKQPSLYEEVESITTYGIGSSYEENNA